MLPWQAVRFLSAEKGARIMQYEVENKFPVTDLSRLTEQLEALGAQFDEVIDQVDMYFAHPVRDFAVTDEALRIRRIGDTNLITYKGPKIDQATKTRRELELPLAAGAERVEQYAELLVALGFRTVAEVRKRRRTGQLDWQAWRSSWRWTKSARWDSLWNWRLGSRRADCHRLRQPCCGWVSILDCRNPNVAAIWKWCWQSVKG